MKYVFFGDPSNTLILSIHLAFSIFPHQGLDTRWSLFPWESWFYPSLKIISTTRDNSLLICSEGFSYRESLFSALCTAHGDCSATPDGLCGLLPHVPSFIILKDPSHCCGLLLYFWSIDILFNCTFQMLTNFILKKKNMWKKQHA